MASAFVHTTPALSAVGNTSDLHHGGALEISDMLSCLVLTWSEGRGQLLQSVARDEAWQAQVCADVQEFLRSVFQLDLPLTVIDLPASGTASYDELRDMAARACGINRSLLVVCGSSDDPQEELWARQLGAWAYLPGTDAVSGLRLVFAEARKAMAQKSSAYAEACGY